ncbi:hypothetical protein F5Y16DRAFT_205060 [Xylariaceae sp. FL0255]|nr:hypothetical protein F5Y16DRAFT_205060 [Xylariaceae sp. FL0255]
MSGFYQLPSSSFTDVDVLSGDNSAEIQDAQLQHQQSPTQTLNPPVPFTNPYQNLGYFSGFPEASSFQPPKPPPSSSRSRKKSVQGPDHVKHRRTRSGCYTCRSRRVKCDEARPICDRCRKGNRDCMYPEPPAPKGSAGTNTPKEVTSQSGATTPESSLDDGEDAERDQVLGSILDDEELEETPTQTPRLRKNLRRKGTSSSLSLRKTSIRHGSETPSQDGSKGSSSTISTSTVASFAVAGQLSDSSQLQSPIRTEWSHLTKDLQFYLAYFCRNITFYTYGLPNDPDNFYNSILPTIAARDGSEPLLYALVGFAAYHYTIRNPNGKIEDFLGYYNKSVTLLISSLKHGAKNKLPILLAVLQLATIEEYLGDWVNLTGHQKAAFEILTLLYTPENIMNSPTSRSLLTWYVRFDIFGAMMGGLESALPREFLTAAVENSRERVAQNPDDVIWVTESHSSALRLMSWDMTRLFGKNTRGEMSTEVFEAEHNRVAQQLLEYRDELSPILKDPRFYVDESEISKEGRSIEDEVMGFCKPGHLFKAPLFSTTILLQEWNSLILMHKSQEGLALQEEPPEEIKRVALDVCEAVESLRLLPTTPNGALTMMQAPLSLAVIFLLRDEKYHMWIRRRYADLEREGNIFHIKLRVRMAQLFRDPTCEQWWLPDDEGLNPTLRSIRAFADERNGNPVTQETEAIREMVSIFSKMRVEHDDTLISPVESPTANTPTTQGKGKNVPGRY